MDNVGLAEQYLESVSSVDDLPKAEIIKNRAANQALYIAQPWSVYKLFSEYLKVFKPPVQLTRNIKGPITQMKSLEILNEHYKDYTFKPKI